MRVSIISLAATGPPAATPWLGALERELAAASAALGGSGGTRPAAWRAARARSAAARSRPGAVPGPAAAPSVTGGCGLRSGGGGVRGGAVAGGVLFRDWRGAALARAGGGKKGKCGRY